MSYWEVVLARTSTPEWEIAVRLIASIVFGAVIGWEREYKNRPAGLRTHILVCLASATFTIVAVELVNWAGRNDATSDPIRAIEAVTAGVAFLAAGTIIQARGQVQGLTTGASLWLAGAIGVASGTGMYSLAVMVTVLALIILTALQWLANRINGEKANDGDPT
jgi:putative Mg2+ transporter-C (MgtC) family protein